MPNPINDDEEIESIRRVVFTYIPNDVETRLRLVIIAARSSKLPKKVFTDMLEEIYDPVVCQREDAARIDELEKLPKVELDKPFMHMAGRYREHSRFTIRYVKQRLATLRAKQGKQT